MRLVQASLFLLLLLVLSLTSFSSRADENFDTLWQQAAKEHKAEWRMYEGEFQRKDEEFERLWQKRKGEIEKKWDEALRSTKKEWIDYSPSLDSRSQVNFQDGFVEVTAVVPAAEKDIPSRADDLIAEQIRRVFSKDNASGTNVLGDQVAFEPDRPVSANTLPQFIEKTKKKAVVDKKPFVAKDGLPRVKVKIRFDLLPNHLQIRAKKYYRDVEECSRRFRVLPELVMAVIHTESYFNPLAVSPANAHGLMQLIPKYGARDAYRMVYGKDRLVPPDYLYVPKNNIELGTAYLSLLKNNSFSQVDDQNKRRFLVICSYNWGPGAVARKIVERNDVDGMAGQELYQVLRERTPEETANYLERVTERMKIYARLFR